jgi:hypothetical protein
MFDLDRPLQFDQTSHVLMVGPVRRTIAALHHTLQDSGDPALMFCSEVSLALSLP